MFLSPSSLLVIGRSFYLPSPYYLSLPTPHCRSVGLPPYCRSFGLPLPLLCIVGRSIYLQVSSVLSVGLPESTYLLHIISRSPRLLPPPYVGLSVGLPPFSVLHIVGRQLVLIPSCFTFSFGWFSSLLRSIVGRSTFILRIVVSVVGHSPFLLRIIGPFLVRIVGRSPSLRIVGRSTSLLRIVTRVLSVGLPSFSVLSVGLPSSLLRIVGRLVLGSNNISPQSGIRMIWFRRCHSVFPCLI